MKPGKWVGLALWLGAANAAETDVEAVLARFHPSGPTEFHYQETRTSELASTPWQGQGYMLSGTDGSLVKLQLIPQRVIMAVADGQMVYWDPEQNQRHTASVTRAGAAAEQITALQSLLQGQARSLQSRYSFSAERHGTAWTLRLTPKTGQAPSLELTEDESNMTRRILIREPDGDATEYRMEKTGEGDALTYSIQRLLTEALGE